MRNRRSRVIVADDDEEMRRLLESALEKDGHEVIGAASGDGLVKAFLASYTPPDVIVSDVRMPGLGGVEVLRALRQHGMFTPVVLITAFGSKELHEEAQELGAAAVLDKPFDMDALRSAVREVLTR